MNKILIQEKKVEEIARRQIISALREILSDPDAGLALRKKFILKLKKSFRSKQEGRIRHLAEVLRNY